MMSDFRKVDDHFARELGLSQVFSLISFSLSRELVSPCERKSFICSQVVSAVETDLANGGEFLPLFFVPIDPDPVLYEGKGIESGSPNVSSPEEGHGKLISGHQGPWSIGSDFGEKARSWPYIRESDLMGSYFSEAGTTQESKPKFGSHGLFTDGFKAQDPVPVDYLRPHEGVKATPVTMTSSDLAIPVPLAGRPDHDSKGCPVQIWRRRRRQDGGAFCSSGGDGEGRMVTSYGFSGLVLTRNPGVVYSNAKPTASYGSSGLWITRSEPGSLVPLGDGYGGLLVGLQTSIKVPVSLSSRMRVLTALENVTSGKATSYGFDPLFRSERPGSDDVQIQKAGSMGLQDSAILSKVPCFIGSIGFVSTARGHVWSAGIVTKSFDLIFAAHLSSIDRPECLGQGRCCLGSMVGFCLLGPVWCYAAGKGKVIVGFRGRLLFSPLCVLYIVGHADLNGIVPIKLVRELLGYLCESLSWFIGGVLFLSEDIGVLFGA